MIRIILGILILLSLLGIAPQNQVFVPTNQAELTGYVTSKILFFILAAWLIYSGFKKRNRKTEKISIDEFVKTFFGKYRDFLKKYIAEKKPPFFVLIMWLYGISILFDRMDIRLFLGKEYMINNWVAAWLAAIILGIILGFIGYWIMGSLYHVRVWLSGGSKNMLVSRHIFLYAGLPIFITAIFTKIIDTLVYGNEYFIYPTNEYLDILWGTLAVVAIVYSIILSYRAVVLIQKTKPVRSIIFFIILPALFYIFVFGGIVYNSSKAPQQALDYNEQAIILMNQGQYEEAETLFNLSLDYLSESNKENLINVYGNLALLNEYQGEIDEAVKNYQKAFSYTKPGLSGHYSILGQINLLEGKTEEAVLNFKKAIELNPDNFDANNNLGLLYLGEIDPELEVDYEQALAYNEKAYNLNNDIATMQNLAQNYFMLERFEDSLTLFQIVDAATESAIAKYFLGLIYYMSDDLTRAKLYLSDAVALNPELYNEDVEMILNEIN